MSSNMEQKVESNLSNVLYSQSGKLYGTYRGWVVSRADLFGIGRIKVHIPELQRKTISENKFLDDGHDDVPYKMEAIWVTPRRLQHIIHTVPGMNQWVEVKFEEGDPNRGYYTSAIIHLDEPIFELKVDGGIGLDLALAAPKMDSSGDMGSMISDIAGSLGFSLPGPSSFRITPANDQMRLDNGSSMYITPDFGLHDILNIPSNLLIGIVSDTHNQSSFKMGHYDNHMDNKFNSHVEKRTGSYRSVTQHDAQKYIHVKNPEGDGMIMHHGKNSDENYVETFSAKGMSLMMHDDEQSMFLKTPGNAAVAASDVEQECYIGYGVNYTPKKHNLTVDSGHSTRKYDAWYGSRTRKVTNNVTSTQYDSHGGMGTSNITKQTNIMRGGSTILMDENSGNIYLN